MHNLFECQPPMYKSSDPSVLVFPIKLFMPLNIPFIYCVFFSNLIKLDFWSYNLSLFHQLGNWWESICWSRTNIAFLFNLSLLYTVWYFVVLMNFFDDWDLLQGTIVIRFLFDNILMDLLGIVEKLFKCVWLKDL